MKMDFTQTNRECRIKHSEALVEENMRRHNYGKPYYRHELGNKRFANKFGNMVDKKDDDFYEKTHIVIERILTPK